MQHNYLPKAALWTIKLTPEAAKKADMAEADGIDFHIGILAGEMTLMKGGLSMLIDTHAHLDMEAFRHDLEAVIKRASEGGVVQIITVGIDHESSSRALELAKRFEPIYAAVGCHPHEAQVSLKEGIESLARAASHPKVVAWGEIGLDFYWKRSPPEAQLELFSHQLEMAVDLRLPVIVHDRDAHEETLATLKRMGKGKRRGVIHCFSGDYRLAMTLIGLGYLISIPGTVTYKNASQVRDVASRVPLESLLIETDAPFLPPSPKRGERNEPFFVTFTAREIARLRKMDLQELARCTSDNARTLFGLPS
jgi:TatD DNase family protein